MDEYSHMAGMWLVGEDMPQESNAVSLHAENKDQHGMPTPNVHFDDHPNDIAMREHAYKQGSAVYDAAGAKENYLVPPYPSTHNLGTCRMSANAKMVCAMRMDKLMTSLIYSFQMAVSSQLALQKIQP